jgi:mannose-6-phosphate isomerase-like protein (cupin superfamily)
MKKIRKLAVWTLILLFLYLGVGYLLHLVIFPEYKPVLSGYFQPGDELYSKQEGLRQTVQRHENGYVYTTLLFEPWAVGPPLHIHTRFDELFEGNEQPLAFIVGRERVTLMPGEQLWVKKGTPHKMFNNTDMPVTMNMTGAGLPEQFAVYLSQVYGYMDESPDNLKPPKVIFQMAMFSQYLDSYIGDGPPVALQKTLFFLIRPLARLLGYRSYYQKYSLKKDNDQDIVNRN